MRREDPFAHMPEPDTDGEAKGGRGAAGALTPDEFARRFERAGRLFWTIAAGVLGDRGEVDDVLQEACMLALGKLGTYREDVSFTAWVGRFVRNAARNHARKRVRRATHPVAPAELVELAERGASGALLDGGPAPDLPVDAMGRLRPHQPSFDDALLAALSLLGATQRAALLLRTVHELSYREIASVLEIPQGTAMSHVHRARRALREALFQRPLESVEELR